MAEANEEKNAKMKEALGIKKDYKDGSSFDQELKAAQRAATQLAWEAKQKELEKQKEKEEIKRWGFNSKLVWSHYSVHVSCSDVHCMIANRQFFC